MIVGCYTMDLYCDGAADCPKRHCHPSGDELVPPAQFTGANRKECSQYAKKRGWDLNHKAGTALCRACSKAGVIAQKLE